MKKQLLFILLLGTSPLVFTDPTSSTGVVKSQSTTKDRIYRAIASQEPERIRLVVTTPCYANIDTQGSPLFGGFHVTPLGYAAAGGDLATIECLLDLGAKINGINFHTKRTAFTEAIIWGNPKAALFLLERGAKIEVGDTRLSEELQARSIAIYQQFLATSKTPEQLPLALSSQEPEPLVELVSMPLEA